MTNNQKPSSLELKDAIEREISPSSQQLALKHEFATIEIVSRGYA